MEYIVKKINKSFDEARGFFQSSIKATIFEGETYVAFPHYKGKDGVTEFGGTSSALAALRVIDVNGIMNKSTSQAIEWLNKKQQSGAWQFKGLYCSYITAAILCDLYGYELDNDVLENAIRYIISCYNEKEGYFLSYPSDDGIPHIYVTFICLKALALYGKTKSIDFDKIKTWIEKSQNWDGNWGVNPCDSSSTYSHTVYAIGILSMCGLSKQDIKDRYTRQIKWLNKGCISLHEQYDSEEIIKQDNTDVDETAYKEVIFQHACAAMIGEFNLKFNHLISSTFLVKRILLNQYNGGWGISHNKLTMWETEANLLFLSQYKEKYIEAPAVLKILCQIVYYLSVKSVLTIISICFILFSISWLVNNPDQINELVVLLMTSLVFTIASNLIGNKK